LAPPFFVAFFFFAAIVLSMERVLNAGPIPRWIGRQQPDANIRLVPRAGNYGANCDRLVFSISASCRTTFRRTIINSLAKPVINPISAHDNHTPTPKGVKETSRSFKGGASNLPATLIAAASEALLNDVDCDAVNRCPARTREADGRI
jgi:hypothetical protein